MEEMAALCLDGADAALRGVQHRIEADGAAGHVLPCSGQGQARLAWPLSPDTPQSSTGHMEGNGRELANDSEKKKNAQAVAPSGSAGAAKDAWADIPPCCNLLTCTPLAHEFNYQKRPENGKVFLPF